MTSDAEDELRRTLYRVVDILENGLVWLRNHGRPWSDGDSPLEWGERIPDNETLKAMRKLAAATPYAERDGFPACIHCGANEGEPHAPDCPWVRSQEAKNAEVRDARL